MVGQLEGALTFALVCITVGATLGYWLGRLSANHRLLEENRVLSEQLLAREKFTSDQTGSSVWLIVLLIFLAGLMIIWLR